jgi:hypothetical protein
MEVMLLRREEKEDEFNTDSVAFASIVRGSLSEDEAEVIPEKLKAWLRSRGEGAPFKVSGRHLERT